MIILKNVDGLFFFFLQMLIRAAQELLTTQIYDSQNLPLSFLYKYAKRSSSASQTGQTN